MSATPVPAAAAPKTNTLSIIALIAGILGFNLVAVIIGHIALGQIKRTGEGGRVLAIVGLVLGYIGIVAIIIVIIATTVLAAASTTS
jgi:peptidyl-prolyl cis-trans isomerase B (cyclophilin B)